MGVGVCAGLCLVALGIGLDTSKDKLVSDRTRSGGLLLLYDINLLQDVIQPLTTEDALKHGKKKFPITNAARRAAVAVGLHVLATEKEDSQRSQRQQWLWTRK